MMTFMAVDGNNNHHLRLLYTLLSERRPDESISHQYMPTWSQHVLFVQSKPYKTWRLLFYHDACVGAGYVTQRDEIGVGVFNLYKRRGYGRIIVREMQMCGGRLANINPSNAASIALFESLGFKHIQNIYSHD